MLPLNQYPKEIARSDITNCLTHTMYAISFKAKLCRPWKFELILSRAETYHVLLKTILLEYCCCVLCERMGNYAIYAEYLRAGQSAQSEQILRMEGQTERKHDSVGECTPPKCRWMAATSPTVLCMLGTAYRHHTSIWVGFTQDCFH